MGQIVRAIEGMAEACRALDFPVVSGNVSLYNETDGRAIPPTPVVGAVGLIEDVSRIATLARARSGDALILVGETRGHIGASLYAREWLGLKGGDLGAPPPVDLEADRRHADFVRTLIERGLVNAVHDVSDGGIACAAAEMALASGMGLTLGLQMAAGAFFGEGGGRYLVAVSGLAESGIAALKPEGVELHEIGQFDTNDEAMLVFGARRETLPLSRLLEAHEGWLPRYMKGVAQV